MVPHSCNLVAFWDSHPKYSSSQIRTFEMDNNAPYVKPPSTTVNKDIPFFVRSCHWISVEAASPSMYIPFLLLPP